MKQDQVKQVNQTAEKLSYSARCKSALWALVYMVLAAVVLIYGVIFTTNILSQLNPLNNSLNVMIALGCYALVAATFYLLWRKCSHLLTQAFSGFKT